MRTATSVLLVATSLLACSDVTGPGPVEPITELPRPLTAIEAQIVTASNGFAFDLAGQLLPEKPEENLFFSPMSASMALGMVLNGADGDTWTQIRDVLGFGALSQEEINSGYADLMNLLLTLDPSVTTAIGNSVWSDQGFPVLPAFQDRVASSFDAEARELDLQAPSSLDAINGWASDATNGRIDRMFDQLSPNTVMVLLNAIYFNANWTARFDRSETEDAPFTRPDGSEVTAKLMRIETELRGGWTEEASIVELPYGGGAFTMTLAVPHDGVNVNEMVAALDGDRWNGWMDDFFTAETVVYLPRMEFEWEAKLNEMLMALGMEDAFGGNADFSRLTPGGGISIDIVKQKAFVNVDEEGTEAAAVTSVSFQSGPRTVRADRPFLFVLRERLTGSILFMAVVNDPSG